NDLIDITYDTPRIIKTTGPDNKEAMAAINGMMLDDEIGPDITEGKYGITFSTGPSYVTKRIEAAEAMLNFVNAAPPIAAVAPHLIVEAQDRPNAEAIAERFRRALPPNLLGQDDLTPEQAQAQQAQQLAQQQAAELQTASITAEIDEKRSRAAHA